MAMASWDATLALLRWRQTRRGYDGDDALLRTAFALLASERRLREAEARTNVPADRIATELVHLALLLITKPRRDTTDGSSQSRAVLKLLRLALKALRATGDASLAIPLNACNLLLAAMADTLESAGDAADDEPVDDVLQVFVFLFAMASDDRDGAPLGTPSFNMYKPPTNVFSAFMQRACTAVFAQLGHAPRTLQAKLVKFVLAVMRVFQELQSSQMNKKKVFVAIAKTSFREIVGYRHALLAHAAKVEGVTEILDVLDRIIVDALFDSEHLREFDGALTNLRLWQDETQAPEDDDDSAAQHKRKKQRRKQGSEPSSLVSYQRHLFDELKAFLSDASVASDAKESIGSLLEVLVRGFSTRIRAAANEKIEDSRSDLKSSKKRVANVIATTSTAYSPFKFWAELCGVAFGAFETASDKEDKQDAVALLICVYESLFRALCESDVYRVTEDTEEQEQFAMMQTILSRFVALLRTDTALSETAMRRVCSVVSSAVQCTPNLVNRSLVPIFEVVGTCSAVPDAASACMVELLRAYESMRLVDAFLRSCCATADDNQPVASGLLSIFSHSTTEATLRRTYMTLPPGQLEIVWRLLTDKLAVLCGARTPDAVAAKMALVRSLLAVFLQEIHITPQNRAKVGELVADSHEKLLVTLASRVSRFQNQSTSSKKAKKEATFSSVERELFSLFGEFLALYDGLAPAVRAATLDVVLAALEPKLAPVMTSLLAGDSDQIVGAAAGIVKIGVHQLRRVASSSSANSSADVASLIVDRVVQWRCWDAVAFYLPELVNDIDQDRAAALFVELVESYLGQHRAAPDRILRDAAFYEITALQRVASRVFTTVGSRKGFASSDRATVQRFFDLLLTIPSGYLDVASAASGELLISVLKVHQVLLAKTLDDSDIDQTATLAAVASWLETYLVAIARHGSSDVHACVSSWTEFLLLDAVTGGDASARLVRAAVEHLAALSHEAQAAQIKRVDAALTKLLKQKTSRGYAASATVLAAVASLPEPEASTTMIRFVDALLANIAADPSIVASLENDSSFELLTALVRYAAAVPESASPARREKIVALMEAHLSNALALTRQTIVEASTPPHGARLAFFARVCETFHLLRSIVTLETFSGLLAAALALAADSDVDETHKANDSDRPLACLVQHANKDEFELLVATLERELLVPRTARRVAALKALAGVLETDKKLANTRRQVLSAHKTSFVGLFVQLFSHALNAPAAAASASSAALCVWTLRVFVLFYCKAELFTWKPHELLQVFAGFQPLTVLAAAPASTGAWTPAQVNTVWLLSYNLLLRVVRHHFASLVNGVPHMVDALNALLRVLIASSSSASHLAPYAPEWAANLARLYGYLKPQDAALRKHVVYLLLTFLRGAAQGTLSLALQHKLRPGVFALLEICSLFEKEQLYASLDATGKSLLKSLDTSYKLTYRYAGKV